MASKKYSKLRGIWAGDGVPWKETLVPFRALLGTLS